MHLAAEQTFTVGKEPVLTIQVQALARAVARRTRLYDSPYSIHTHSEVQGLLGIVQRRKWDINWLPGMSAPGTPTDTGNRLRAMVATELRKGG